MDNTSFDLIIIGSGPAGCAASIYASRYQLTNVILGKTLGGTISYAHKVENYPGFVAIPGLDLMQEVERHVKALGGVIAYDPAIRITKNDSGFSVFSTSGKEYRAKAVVVATGTERRKLNIPGETELVGKGVSYCVTCDAAFYRGKTVVLVGGSDAACSGAVHLAEYAAKIYMIYRGSALRAEPFWLSQWDGLVSQGKGEAIFNTNIVKIISRAQLVDPNSTVLDMVGAVKLDKPAGGKDVIPVDGVFIEIGGVPGADLIKALGGELNERGYVKVTMSGETSISGIFAAGDMTDKGEPMQQVITAMAWGAMAASGVYKYVKGQKAPKQLSTETKSIPVTCS